VQIECRAWGFRLVKDLSISIAEASVSEVGVVDQIDIHGGVGGMYGRSVHNLNSA
jgi:hypothetical protein